MSLDRSSPGSGTESSTLLDDPVETSPEEVSTHDLPPAHPGRRLRLAHARRKLAAEDRAMLGQLAVERGYLKTEELETYLRAQRDTDDEGPRQPIGTLLMRDGVLTSSQVVELLREQRRRNLLCLFQDWTEGAPEEVLKLLTDPSRHLDGYVLVDEIGRGGMGIVWRAWDTKLRRWVAIKLIHGESGPELARFLREAFAAGRLRHPAIVPVHRVAESEGKPYLVMDLIEGGTLESARLSVRAAAQIMVTIARAVAYAHKRGVIHRDLKPSNLLRDKNGNVYITDFGLAKFGDTGSHESKKPVGVRTVSGATMGTPCYMPPEQALARALDIDQRSDVYSLGATLYKLVTGVPPFTGTSPAEIILKVIREYPKRPRQLNPQVSNALDAIILKCLEKERPRRYPTADALADDLERYLHGEPIQARHSSMFARAVGKVRRIRLRLVSALILAFVSFTVAATVTIAVKDARQQVDDSEIADRRFRALQKYGEAVTLFGRYETTLGRVAQDEHTLALAMEALQQVNEAIALDPNFGPLRITKARILRIIGRTAEAQDELEAGIRLAPDYYGGYLERGWLNLHHYCSQRSLPGMVVTSTGPRRVSSSVESPELARVLARALDDFHHGVQLAEQNSEGKPRNEGDLLLARASAALYSGHPEEARGILAQLRKLGTHPEECADLLGRTSYQAGQFARAIEAYSEAIALRPRIGRLYIDRASARWGLIEEMIRRGTDPTSEVTSAHNDLDQALRLGADEGQAHLLRGHIQHAALLYASRQGRVISVAEWRAVLVHYDRAVSSCSDHVAALGCRALLYRTLGDAKMELGEDPGEEYQNALEDMAEAIRLDGTCGPLYLNRASLHESFAELALSRDENPLEYQRAALADYEAALAADPENFDAQLGAAESRVDLAIQAKDAQAPDIIRASIRTYDELLGTLQEPKVYVARGNARRMLSELYLSGAEAIEACHAAIHDYGGALNALKNEWRIAANLALSLAHLASLVPLEAPKLLSEAEHVLAPHADHVELVRQLLGRIRAAREGTPKDF